MHILGVVLQVAGMKTSWTWLNTFTKINKWSQLFDKKAASPPHMDHSIIFARLCQCAPQLTHASLGQPESIPETASNRFSCFCTAHGKTSLYFTTGRPFPPQKCHCTWWIGIPHLMFPWDHPSPQPKRHVDRFSGLCRAHNCDRPCYSICSTAAQHKKEIKMSVHLNPQYNTIP